MITSSGGEPTFIVIGAVKCGTTSLHRYLDLHPQISMSRVKETNYFMKSSPNFKGPRIESWTDYLATMAGSGEIRGEASPPYSMFPRFPGVPAAIAAALPRAKFLYLVRDPLDRIVSQYMMRMASSQPHIRTQDPDASFEEIVGDLSDPMNPYVCPGLYMTQIAQYLRFFPAERIHVIDNAELAHATRPTLAEIFRFLGVDEAFWDPRMDLRANPSSGKRRVGDRFLTFANRPYWRWLRGGDEGGVRGRLRTRLRQGLSRPVERPRPSEEFSAAVADRFRDEVSELRQFSGLELLTWSV